ncbi:hypothetical protein SAY86_002943 [Trapa natans]|uniref:Uncharacterized protein n=1 Tax=Trapa natans TaxID=22666 RepID=A0AAN7LL33_TRANT|nr:hypothetical protein SAY86_002943 [Trapa natans]
MVNPDRPFLEAPLQSLKSHNKMKKYTNFLRWHVLVSKLNRISSRKVHKKAWTLANLSAGQFMMGVEDNVSTWILPEFDISSTAVGTNWVVSGGAGRSGSAAGALDSSAGAQASIKLEHA